MELENILGDNKNWRIGENYYADLVIERENFLDFYKIRAIIRSTTYYSEVIISLYYKGCQCFYRIVDVEYTISIPSYVEDFIRNNFKNLYELPKFIKLLDELGLNYDISFFDRIHIKFLIPTEKGNKAIKWKQVSTNTGDIKELIERCRCYLLYNWKMIEDSSSGIKKYCKGSDNENDTNDETVHTDPIFPG